jgi:thiol-disulfide isomerase/thioredoxin
MSRNLLASILIGSLAMACVSTWGLSIGELAPTLKAEQWINGGPVNPAEPDGKTTYVIEFWATWCPPCKKSIPHLNELHERLAEKGVVFVGVTTESEKVVKPFVEKLGIKYRVAIAKRDEIDNTWMKNVDGIPHAFIVDTNGVVIWAGHPMDRLAEALDDVVAGTFDPAKYAKETADADEALDTIQQLLIEGDFEKALAHVDELLSATNADIRLYHFKLGLLAQLDKPSEVKATYRKMTERFWEDSERLNAVAWMACTGPFALCDLELAWKAAHRAAELTKRENVAILDTLARVYYSVGRLSEAVDIQKEAVGKASDEDETKALRAVLDYYQEAKRLSETLDKKE